MSNKSSHATSSLKMIQAAAQKDCHSFGNLPDPLLNTLNFRPAKACMQSPALSL